MSGFQATLLNYFNDHVTITDSHL